LSPAQTRQLKCLSENLHVLFNPFFTAWGVPAVVVKRALDVPSPQIHHVFHTCVEPVPIFNSICEVPVMFVDDVERPNSLGALMLGAESITDSLELGGIAQLD
jgi:hypothetical protein